MALILKLSNPIVGIWKIDESADSLLALMPHPGEHLPALSRLTNGRRRQEWLAVRALLNELTGTEMKIAYRPNGSPFLPGSSLHISISHTNGYAAIALSELSPTGVDIEYMSDRAQRLKSRFLSPDEEAFIERGKEKAHSLVCWCAKEALYKRVGESGVNFSEAFRLMPFPCEDSGSIEATAPCLHNRHGAFRLNYLISRYFVIAWLLDSSEESLPPALNSAMATLPPRST
ncbi:MAG: 4'-phosphopantetheinyl transferase superfamily protein [Tannerellaceae bacterium]|jgi:phosphopantetheinyl transferase|nr:4'-phosphopantetheinyl transferase superfamily protein [Tannerellaceae bacterium]